MSTRPAPSLVESSLSPEEGWHCSHFFYRFDRDVLAKMGNLTEGRQQLVHLLCQDSAVDVERFQVSIVSGHKADFGLMLMGPDPLAIDAVHQRLLAAQLGPAIVPTYSFVSVTEISEYVPTVQQYGERLVEEGVPAESDAYQAKINAYAAREPMMRKQRLYPDFPEWPATCFYPMNKKRKV
ncbi:MAG: chlorite dismutase family protein, partial [Planctomycetales bacterium]|nr:chlorite dismutase family protein [Planctomycetales bacterium]